MFRWKFADGSELVLEDAAWAEALALRLSRDAERLRLFDEGFLRAVEDSWERKRLPGAWAEEEPWTEAFESRAELAREILRRLVAPVLCGLALRAEHPRARGGRIPAGMARAQSQSKVRWLRGRS